jgi:hypothetical protein
MNEHYTEVLNSPPRTDQYDISRLIEFLGSNGPTSDQAFRISDAYSGFPMESLGEDPILAAIFSGNHNRELTIQEQSSTEEYQVPEVTFDLDSSLQGYQRQEISDLQIQPSKVLVASGCANTFELPFTSFGALQASSLDDLQYVASSDLALENFQIPQVPVSGHQHMSCPDIWSSPLDPPKEIERFFKPPRKRAHTKRELADPQNSIDHFLLLRLVGEV